MNFQPSQRIKIKLFINTDVFLMVNIEALYFLVFHKFLYCAMDDSTKFLYRHISTVRNAPSLVSLNTMIYSLYLIIKHIENVVEYYRTLTINIGHKGHCNYFCMSSNSYVSEHQY